MDNSLIRRQAAIELAMQYCPDDDGTCSKADEDIRNLLDELENLPSAQPEPKSPLYYGDGYSEEKMVYDSAECPNCGYIYDEGDQVWGEPYCPHCGQAIDWSES